MAKCLIIDEMHPSIEPLLRGISLPYDYLPNITPDEVFGIIHEYEGLILRSKMKIKTDLLEKAVKLRFIARAGAGVDEIDEDYLKRRKITLINAPEGNRDAVGEHALGMLLCLFNKINLGDLEVRKRQWKREENRGLEVKGKTVALIGYGNMGRAFAQRLSGFECEVIAHDKYKINYGNLFAKEASLDEVFEKADILSLHTPLTSETLDMIDQEFLGKFQKPIYLINTARGAILSFATLVAGIKNGTIKGAALDVLENEKFQTLSPAQEIHLDWLAQQPNVLFTPHVGGWTFESYERLNEVLVKKIHRLLATF